MRRPATHRYIISVFVLVLLSPVVSAVASENPGEVLTMPKSRLLLQIRQTASRQMEPSGEFILGVRNRSVHERASGSTIVGVPLSAHEPQPVPGPRLEPGYTIRAWWNGASQTKKTATIVGGAVVFLIIFL